VTATLAVAGRANANVSLVANEELVSATWSAALPTGATDVFLALSHDGGASFGPTVAPDGWLAAWTSANLPPLASALRPTPF